MVTRKILLTALALSAAFIAGMAHLRAHTAVSGWEYPIECCSNQDCAVLDPGLVRETPEGWEIAGQAGGGFFARGKERQSPDGEYHLCRSQYSGVILCFFVPPMGS